MKERRGVVQIKPDFRQVFTVEKKDGKRSIITIRHYLHLGIPGLPASIFSASNSCWSLPHPREHVVPLTCREETYRTWWLPGELSGGTRAMPTTSACQSRGNVSTQT